MNAAYTDMEQLAKLCNGDQNRMQRYIRMFLQGTPGLFEQMRTAQAAADLEGLSRTAHGLKPQAQYMGARLLNDRLQLLENVARAGDLTASASALDECVRIHAEVMNELNAVVDSR